MLYSRAEIDAEKARRAQLSSPAYNYSRAEIDAEKARRRQLTEPNKISNQSQPRESFFESLSRKESNDPREQLRNNLTKILMELGSVGNSSYTGFHKNIGGLTHGILQPALESGIFGEKARNSSPIVANERNQAYEQELQKNPGFALGGNIAGELFPSAVAAGVTGGASLGTKLPGFLKYLMPIVGGGIAGATTGAARYVEPGESRLENSIKEGAAGAVGGSLASATKGAINAVKSVKNAYPAKKLAEKIISEGKSNSKKYKNSYQNLFEDSNKSGLNLLNSDSLDKDLVKYLNKKDASTYTKFLEKPNIEEARKIELMLSNNLKNLTNTSSSIILPSGAPSLTRATDALLSGRKSIRKVINEKIPKINFKTILNNSSPKEVKNIKKYVKTPTIENAHWAQNSLGSIERRLLRKSKSPSGLIGEEAKVLDEASKQQQKIKDSIHTRFSNMGRKDLENEYKNLTKGYSQEVLPYKTNRNINKFKERKLTKEDLVDALMRDKEFKAKLGEKYPELQTRRKVKGVKSPLIGVGGAAAGLEALHLLGLF